MEVCFIQVKWLTSSVPLIWLQVFTVCLRFSPEECYMTSKHSNFFPGVTEYFTAADLRTWWLRTASRKKSACKFITEINGDLCCTRLAILSSKGGRWMRQKHLLSPVKKLLCLWLPLNQRKRGLGGINFYLSLLRQKCNVFQSFCNSVPFPRRTKKKDCGCVFSEQVLIFADCCENSYWKMSQ